MSIAPTPAQRRARKRELRAVAERLGHEFEDLDLLDRALTHASTGNEGKTNYERLEFLGDAFLGFAVADHLYRMEPEIPEGELTEARAALVSRPPLARIARELELANVLVTGRGMDMAALQSDRIQADLVEAVLAAIYLDGGVRAARSFVKRHVMPLLDSVRNTKGDRDAKSRLLHHCQRESLGQPVYELVEVSGPQHRQHFQVRVLVDGEATGQGEGRSKQAAEKAAAAQALEALQPKGQRKGGGRKAKGRGRTRNGDAAS